MKTICPLARPQLALCLLSALAPATLMLAGCGGASVSSPALPTNYAPRADLTYSAVSNNSNALIARVTSLATDAPNLDGTLATASNGTQNVEFSGINRLVQFPQTRRFDVILEAPAGQSFAVGQSYPLAFGTRNNILVRQSSTTGDRLWVSDGGLATVTAASRNAISLQLTGARFVPSPTFFATGTFVLDGTLGASSLRVASAG